MRIQEDKYLHNVIFFHPNYYLTVPCQCSSILFIIWTHRMLESVGLPGEICSKSGLACCWALTERIAKVAPMENRCMLENADDSVDYVRLIPPTGIPSTVSYFSYIVMWSRGNKWLLGHWSSGVFMGQETWDIEPAYALQLYPLYIIQVQYYLNMWRWIGKPTVGSKFHDLFNQGKWLLLPKPDILNLYLHGRCNPMSVPPAMPVCAIFELSITFETHLVQEPYYRYMILVLNDMASVPITCHITSDAMGVTTAQTHSFPYPHLGFILSHLHPHYVIFCMARTILNFFGVQRSISKLKVQIHFWRCPFWLHILDGQNHQPQCWTIYRV